MKDRFVINPHVQRSGWSEDPPTDPLEAHRKMPEYRVNPLHTVHALADELGVGTALVKDEGSRLTLPAFKILGSSWAIIRLLDRELPGGLPEQWSGVEDLREAARELGDWTLVTATDGNHGRGVARMARWLGMDAVVFMPAGSARARVEAIEEEGADVTVIKGNYDAAVRMAREAAEEPACWLVQDTSWPGYEEIPAWVIEGYATLMWEIEQQLREQGRPLPDVVAVPIGVGALVAAVIRHWRRPGLDKFPRILGVEPLEADCTLASIQADQRVTIPGISETIMAGLNCNTLATIVWPLVRKGVDAVVAIEDAWVRDTMRIMADAGITSGESGASGAAGLLAVSTSPALAPLREHLQLGPESSVMVFNTESVTDPETYERIVHPTR